MKTVSKFFILALSASVAFTSCNKDNTGIPDKDPKFSKLSAEENKAELEKAGVALIDEMSGLTETEAMLAAENLQNISGDSQAKSAVAGVGIIKALANADNNATSLKKFMADTPLSDEIDSIEGIYTWNASIKDFEKEPANNKVVFKFPYTETGTVNDCEFTAEATIVAVNGELTDLAEAPSSLTATLVVKGNEAASYTLTAAYNDKGIPSDIATELKLGTYSWKFTASQNSSSVNNDFKFAHGSKTLINYGFSVGGNLDMTDVQEYADKLDAMDDYVEGTISEAGTLIQDVKLWYQIMDIKLIETANTKDLASKLDAIYTKYETVDYATEAERDAADKASQTELVSLLNSDALNVYLMYVEDNRKIADVSFYLKEYEDTYYDWYLEKDVTDTYYDIAPQFVFGKKDSPVDAEAYLNDGFDELDKAMQDMADEMIAMFPDLDGGSDDFVEEDIYMEQPY